MSNRDQSKEEMNGELMQLKDELNLFKEKYKKGQYCHNQISSIISNTSLTGDEALEQMVESIAVCWSFSNAAQVAVEIYDEVYKTAHFDAADHIIQQSITLFGQIVGKIEVGYQTGISTASSQTFACDDTDLLHSIALRISNFIELDAKNVSLLASEERFSSLMENINDVIYTTDEKANITYVSPSIQKLLGYTQEEIIGKNFSLFIGNKGEQLQSRFEEIQKKFDLQNEYHIISKSGEYHWIRFSSKAIIKEGQFLGVSGVLIDVSETKKFELELQKSESLYRSILTASPDTIFIADLNGIVLFTSPMAKKMFGYEDSEFPLHQSLFDFLDVSCHEKAQKAIGEMFEGIYTGATDYLGIRSDGSQLDLEVNGEFIRDADGNPTSMVFVARDISERKVAEKRLRKSEETYRNLVESVNDVIYEVDINGKIKFVSPSVINVLGYQVEEVLGRNIFEFIYKDDVSHINDSVILLDAKDYNYKEYRYLRKDGSIHWVRSSTSPIFDNGVLVGGTGILTDITERMLALRELRESEERYRSIFKNNHSVMMVLDPDTGIIKDVNASACHFYKWSYHELCGKNISEVNCLSEDELIFEMQQAKTKMRTHFIFKHRLANGEIRDVEVYSCPIKFGNNIFLYSIVHDITNRIKAEKALKRQENELNEAQRIAQMCSWELNPITNHLTWSENYYRIMGIPFGTQMKTEYFLGKVHPDDLHVVDEKYEELLQTHQPVQYDIRVLMPDQSYNWVQNNIVPKFENGKLVRLRGVNIDVTEKKLDEEKIKNQNERLNAIITAIPDLIFVMTKDGTYLEVFATESQKLLIEPEKIIGMNIRQVFDEEMTTLFLQKISDSLHRKAMVAVNYAIKLPNSPSTHFEARIAPFEEDKVLILSRDVTEQAKSDVEIKKLSRVVEQSPVITMITDLKANIEYVNPVFESITGYTQQEVAGCNARILQSGYTPKHIYKEMWQTIRTGKEWHGEWISRKKNGENYWEDVAISSILDADGRIVNYLAIKQNIHARKQNEERLKQSEESYRHMFGNNPQPMWIYDLETLAFLEVNDAAIQHYGYSREEFFSMTLVDIRPIEDLEALMKDIEKSRKGDNKAGEWRHLKKNGELINVEISSHAIVFNDRQARHILVKDITLRKKIEKEILDLNANLENKIEERTTQLNQLNANLTKEIVFRKRTEAALSESERSYRMVVENVNEIFFQTDTAGRWIFLNKSWENVTGFSVSESIGKPFHEFLHPDDHEIINSIFAKLISGEIEHDRHEVRYKTKKGDYRWIEVFGRSGIAENGTISGSYGTLQDITERKRSNELIQKAHTEAEQANQAKSEFLSRMSHELRTPLNSILGFSQLLEMGELNSKQRKSISHIFKSGKYLLQLINEVLDISRIEAGHLAIHPEPISIRQLNQEVLDIVTPIAAERQITLKISGDANAKYQVYSDSQRLRQVMLNLVNNAIKYNRMGGSVTIRTVLKLSDDSGSEMVSVSVIDTGIGISASDIPNIFTPFERIGAEKTNVEGTGLGLAVVNRIMKALGGTIGVESIPDKGSTFWIELPRML